MTFVEGLSIQYASGGETFGLIGKIDFESHHDYNW